MLNFVAYTFLTFYTLFIKYTFIKDLYFYFDDFVVFSLFSETGTPFPLFTDRPIAGLFLKIIFDVFKWNPLPYHLLGALLEVISSLIIYRLFYKLISKDIFSSLLVSIIFIVIPGHSQSNWWVILIQLKFLLILWIASVYLFNNYLINKEKKYLWTSAFIYGVTLFWYEIALFLPAIHSIFYLKSNNEQKISLKKYIQSIWPFAAFMILFGIFRFTDSFGFSSSIQRNGLVPIDQVYTRATSIFLNTFLRFPEIDYTIGTKYFTLIDFSKFISSLLYLSTLLLLIFAWYKQPEKTTKLKTKIFILIFGLSWILYSLLPFSISSAWFDIRHTYLPHLGLATVIMFFVYVQLNFISLIPKKILKNCLVLILLAFICFPITKAAEATIGMGYAWKQVGVEFKIHEKNIKSYYPNVKNNTIFLIKDAEVSRDFVPVFAGDWVIDGFAKKIYPHQGVKGEYYNIPTKVDQIQLIGKIDPTFNYMVFDKIYYPFEQIIILDGANKLKPFSSVNIKTSEGNHLKKLQPTESDASIYPVLDILINN
jgi:hypothetical protein